MWGDDTTGRLLVASPLIGDPNFERTVVLMIEHNPDGALGLVLNRPMHATVEEVLPQWASLALAPGRFHQGGPVAPDSVIALGWRSATEPVEGFTAVVDPLGTVDLHLPADHYDGRVERFRLFAGYSGWGPGQLEGELAAGAWWVLDALPGDAISAEPSDLWSAALARQSGPIAWFAQYPDDPSLN